MTSNLAVRKRMIDAVLSVSVLCLAALAANADDTYKSAQDAYSVGVAHLNSKNYASAQKALEASLALAKDDEFRIRVYEALEVAYRQLPKIDKMLEASEFILRHAQQPAKRSLTAMGLVSFVYQRGKIDEAIKRYEKSFQDNPDDIAAVAVLAYIYARVERDADRAKVYTDRLTVLNTAVARKHAEHCEKSAESVPQLAAWWLKDAAVAWLEAGDNAMALAAAKKSIKAGPEKRSEILTYFWHEALGTVFLKAGEPKLAIKHLEAAVAITTIDGYRKDCEAKLAEARAALKKK